MTAAQERFRGIRDDETLDGEMQDKNIFWRQRDLSGRRDMQRTATLTW